MKVGRRVVAISVVGLLVAGCSTHQTPTPTEAATRGPAPTELGTPVAPEPGGIGVNAVAAWSERHVIVVGSAVGHGAAGVSADGATTWSIVSTATPALQLVTAFGDSDAWALGSCSADPCTTPLFGTTDGGLTWTELPTPPEALRAIAAAEGGRGWAVPVEDDGRGDRAFYRTDDGAASWIQVGSPCPAGWRLVAVAAASATDAWVGCVGQPATIQQPLAVVATRDGGTSWQVVALNDPSTGARVGRIGNSGHLTGMTALDDHLWAWADRGVLSESLDGGRRWSDLPLGSPDVVTVASAALGSDAVGFAIVWDADAPDIPLMRSDDGGQTWRAVASFPR